jgi:hypothetical protein
MESKGMKHLNRNKPIQDEMEQKEGRIQIQMLQMDLLLGKISQTSGESIAEKLVAVLIAAFALLMLAGTVNTSTNLVTKSRKVLKEYYEANNVLEKRNGSSEYVEPKIVEPKNYTVRLSGNASFQWEEVSGYKNNRINSKPVIAYWKKDKDTDSDIVPSADP